MFEVNAAFWDATGVFLVACECGDAACARSVEITPRTRELSCETHRCLDRGEQCVVTLRLARSPA